MSDGTEIVSVARLRRELNEAKEQLRLANIDQVNTEAELAEAQVTLVEERSKHAEFVRELLARNEAVYAEMTAERDRLRAALQPFVVEGIENACDECGGGPCIGCPVSAGRAALGGG